MPKSRVLYWFRTDLRVHDSPALHAALQLNPECLYPVWCWDPHYVLQARVGPNRWQFLLDCQNDLSQTLNRLNTKQKLLVLREAPQTLLPRLCREWKITHLVFEEDTDSYALERDREVEAKVREAGVEVVKAVGRTLWDPKEVVKKNGGQPTMTLNALMKITAKLANPTVPLPTPTSLPNPGNLTLSDTNDQSPGGLSDDFSIPTLEELSIPVSAVTTPHRGGESLALKNLQVLLRDKAYIATFEKPKTAPTAFEPAATTLLSPHLHFGSLSVRKFHFEVQKLIAEYSKSKKVSTPPANIPGQLYFREMYFCAQYAIGHPFSHIAGNSVARYIPWHLPSTIPYSPATPYTIDSPLAHRWFLRWAWGITGFPFVDALMRQLRQEGWIHHLGRHMGACFLTRGGAYISWERGAEIFEELLIDHEPASNAGNWMWLSCTAFFSQYYRCYSPVAFGKKWDPKGTFVRRYVPELKDFPDKWVYEPHLAPESVQRKAGCLVSPFENVDEDGRSILPDPTVAHAQPPTPRNGFLPLKRPLSGERYYPAPMFDFPQRRDICMEKMKTAYGAKVNGDDPRVLDRTVRDNVFGGTKLPEDAVDGRDAEHASQHELKRKRQIDEDRDSGQTALEVWVKKARGN